MGTKEKIKRAGGDVGGWNDGCVDRACCQLLLDDVQEDEQRDEGRDGHAV